MVPGLSGARSCGGLGRKEANEATSTGASPYRRVAAPQLDVRGEVIATESHVVVIDRDIGRALDITRCGVDVSRACVTSNIWIRKVRSGLDDGWTRRTREVTRYDLVRLHVAFDPIDHRCQKILPQAPVRYLRSDTYRGPCKRCGRVLDNEFKRPVCESARKRGSASHRQGESTVSRRPALSAQNNLATATNYQDLWYAAPAESEAGWGINFTHQGTNIFATWFTYDANHNPLWLSALLPQTGPKTFSGALDRTSGPAFSAVSFDPTQVHHSPSGTATVTFTDGNNGTFSYSVDLGDGVNKATQAKAITRQVFQAPGTVCQAGSAGVTTAEGL